MKLARLFSKINDLDKKGVKFQKKLNHKIGDLNKKAVDKVGLGNTAWGRMVKKNIDLGVKYNDGIFDEAYEFRKEAVPKLYKDKKKKTKNFGIVGKLDEKSNNWSKSYNNTVGGWEKKLIDKVGLGDTAFGKAAKRNIDLDVAYRNARSDSDFNFRKEIYKYDNKDKKK